MDPLDLPACAVSIESGYAINVARSYLELMEAKLSQAESDMHAVALEAYRRIADPDKGDYEIHVADVERRFTEDYRTILRFTEVIYLHMVFEAFISRHITELQGLRQGDREVLGDLRKQNKCGIARAAAIYFRDDLKWQVLSPMIGTRLLRPLN